MIWIIVSSCEFGVKSDYFFFLVYGQWWLVNFWWCVGFTSRSVSRSGHDISSTSRNSSASISVASRSEGEILQSSNLKSFSYNEVRAATRNFRPDSVLGEGGFGSVFKGWIDEHSHAATKPGLGIIVAVKRLNQEGFQGHREWLVSINFSPDTH